MAKTVSFGAKPPAPGPSRAGAEDWVKSGQAAPEAPAMKRLTIDVSETLHRQMKSQCAARGVKMADEVRALLARHFGDGAAPEGREGRP